MEQYGYVALLFALFVVPRVLQRFRIPTAITSLGLGVLASLYMPDLRQDSTVQLLATFGIVSLFLFAGLDVELEALHRERKVVLQHLGLQLVSLAIVAAALTYTMDLSGRAASLLGIALLTPSTGFILDSLDQFDLPERARFWIKTKAIATELVALAILFVALQSTSTWELAQSSLFIVVIIILLPVVFRLFAAFVVPHAPKSEFAFLMMVAVACGVATYKMGVYYLVGAFVVGMAAQRLRARIPELASERMIGSVEAFSSLFVPFYFFNAGLHIHPDELGLHALAFGAAFFVVGVAVRLALVCLHRRVAFGETLRESLMVSTPLLPTLVFTLVIAGILQARFGVSPAVFGGLVIYAVLNSLVPALVLRVRIPEIEDELMQEPKRPTVV